MKLGKIVTFILLAIPSTKAVGMQDKAFEDRRKQLHSMTQKDLRGELALICEKIDQNKMILDNDAISLVEEMFTRCECGLNNDHSLDSIRANILAVEAVLSFQINASGKSIIPTSEYTYEHANFGFPDAAVTEDSNGSNIAHYLLAKQLENSSEQAFPALPASILEITDLSPLIVQKEKQSRKVRITPSISNWKKRLAYFCGAGMCTALGIYSYYKLSPESWYRPTCVGASALGSSAFIMLLINSILFSKC